MACRLPEVEEATWYGTPGLKVAGKGFARLRTEAEGGLMLLCTLDEKMRLLASGEPYYTTPHYDGSGSIIVDLELVERAALEELISNAWRIKAPPRLRRAVDQVHRPIGQPRPATRPTRSAQSLRRSPR